MRNLLRVQQLQDGLFEQNAHLRRQRTGLLRDVQAMQAALVPDISAHLEDLAVSVAYQPAEGPAGRVLEDHVVEALVVEMEWGPQEEPL